MNNDMPLSLLIYHRQSMRCHCCKLTTAVKQQVFVLWSRHIRCWYCSVEL